MKQRIGRRLVTRYRHLTGLDVVVGWARGSRDHAVELGLRDGSVVMYRKDGTIEQTLPPGALWLSTKVERGR